MKNASILNENYVKYNETVTKSLQKINKQLAFTFSDIEESVNNLFEAEDLSTESAEYFTFKNEPFIKAILKEDYESELTTIISSNRNNKEYPLDKVVKCAGLNQVLFENSMTKLEAINDIFGEKSVLNEECNTVCSSAEDLRRSVKKLIPLYEEAKNKVTYIMKTISNTKEDKETLIEGLETLAAIKMFIEELK